MLKNLNKTNDKFIQIKDVLLDPEDLIEHAKEVAKIHNVSKDKRPTRSLLKRLDQNFNIITSVYNSLNKLSKNNQNLSHASEWLLDNYYLIEEQVKEVKQKLTKKKYLKLRVLNNGFLKGYPRVYALTLELISHTDGRLDEEQLIKFIKAYQSQHILSIAEIWSLSLMIRIALIEYIRNLCQRIHKIQDDWTKIENLTDAPYDKLLDSVDTTIENMNRLNPVFIEYLIRQIRNKKYDIGNIKEIINNKLEQFNTALERVIEESHNEQAELKNSLGNAITSLKVVSKLDWNDIFETLCVVEGILRDDPLKVYSDMDFESRDYYRQQIADIADKTRIPETTVARKAIEIAKKESNNDENKKGHVGYYLIDNGRKKLLKELGYTGKDNFHDYPFSYYIAPIILIVFTIVTLFTIYTYRVSESILTTILTAVITVIPVSDIAVKSINWLYTHLVPPALLPKLEYRNGISEKATTLVVVPTLLPNVKTVKELVSQLEIHYLSNKEDNLYFALVGDFKDSDKKENNEDNEITKTAIKLIKELNKKYAKDEDIFFFFHRERKFSKTQNRWMGWERKRGALVELNRLLKGAEDTSYSIVTGDISKLKEKVKYVITLDADTKMPLNTAKKLIGTISHPLNKAKLDKNNKIVSEGYGIIQPRISLDIESANISLFTRIFAGQGGIDPYTTAISDIYQDLFREGIFTGKGIYDVDVFDTVLSDTIPDNSILSHDLLEGSYIRTGLATDIELVDGYPSKYNSYIMRLHRWIRGDWQLIKWLFSKVRNREGVLVENPLSTLSKWKILDNLRRSLVPVTLTLLIILGLLLLPGKAYIWVGLALLALGFPLVIEFANYLIMKYYRASRDKLNGNLIYGLKRTFYLVILLFVFLPYEGYMMADAILRTLYRVFISKKNLLEWVTAADVEKRLKNNTISFISRMRPSIFIALLVFALGIFIKPQNLLYIIPITIVWAIGPYVAYKISQPEIKGIEKLAGKDIEILRRIGRKTWAYFEDFSGEENNYLPPDNYQEDPPNGLAYRTSPTNIGFLLISILAARDFGYISTTKMIDRIEKTISTIEKLDTWKGHLYNWYDIKTLEPLRPYFISTVDNGNFIAYLITLKEGLKEYLKKPLIDKSLVKGIKDTLDLIEDKKPDDEYINFLLSKKEINLKEWRTLLKNFSNIDGEVSVWHQKLVEMINSFSEEIDEILPTEEEIEILKDLPNENFNDYIQKIISTRELTTLNNIYEKLLEKITKFINDKNNANKEKLLSIKEKILKVKNNVQDTVNKTSLLIDRIDKIIDNAKFEPLYDKKRHLFAIGYNIQDEELTNSYYDLLASEARTVSYIAIAKGEIPEKHWYKLGRALSKINGYRGLVSWTGTMFEYLMPSLIMKNYDNTLMDETYSTVIKAQKKYGKARGVPWGTSESGYFAFDIDLNYQYKAFGVPDLGLKRGLVQDMVVSCYSTLLALPFDPKGAIENIKKLISDGLEGLYGLYEAVDYTPKRLPYGEKKGIIKSFMAHHQGMSFIALNNYINENIMQKRFHSNPVMKAGEILLQEKVPIRAIITKENKELIEPLEEDKQKGREVIREFGLTKSYLPKCQLLSNGRYSILVTDKGIGYSKK
ncbi:glucoamylase family protein [Thermohalobacter berrensis]|uniref:glucoamylase family protein n=1 Tax=Thermohalobacter berrensis TaxID=99594 RepID=UPI001FAB302C|nr:glucoamylase family protein [Thermohalobacter berrensis]